MAQLVYNDGSLSEVTKHNKDSLSNFLENALRNKDVDHIRLFDLEKGNKVGIPEIEEKQIEETVEKVVEAKLKDMKEAERMNKELGILKRQFDERYARSCT